MTRATASPVHSVEKLAVLARSAPLQSAIAYRNYRILRVLEKIARSFQDADIPLMVLKGAALNLTLYRRPDARPMGDLDLMVRESDAARAGELIARAGGVRTAVHVRRDFFPIFHYETEYVLGAIYPVKIDLHVRPFRPLRYARTVPPHAFWSGAVRVPVGEAAVLMPGPTDMLLHLLVHSAVHGNNRQLWLEDIALWVETYGDAINWEEFITHAQCWQLTPAARSALRAAEIRVRPVFPSAVCDRIAVADAGWRDRLALWQASRDAEHPAMHILVNALCTPDWRFAARYVLAAALPDSAYMAEELGVQNAACRWLAHLRRWLHPLFNRRPNDMPDSPVRLAPSAIHGVGVFAGRRFAPGDCIARFEGRPAANDGRYVIELKNTDGRIERFELNGRLRYLNHSCAANAVVDGFVLKAAQTIRPGEELTIDYGPSACNCRNRKEKRPATTSRALAKAG